MSGDIPSIWANRFSAKSGSSATPRARPTATTSFMTSSANWRACGLARIGPMVERIAEVMLDIVTMTTNFCHSSSEMSAGISALMSLALQASRKACARGEALLSNSPKASRSMVPALRTTPGRTSETPI